ncbi:MAG: hypothetical protein V1717_04285 [Candidatus Micrarchaeota archaeon]
MLKSPFTKRDGLGHQMIYPLSKHGDILVQTLGEHDLTKGHSSKTVILGRITRKAEHPQEHHEYEVLPLDKIAEIKKLLIAKHGLDPNSFFKERR